MAEQSRIARWFAALAQQEPGAFSLTDDAAVLAPPAAMQLVVTTDSVISGLHVLPDASAAQIASKLMRRNLSDLAAMGATPWRYFLNLHTPTALPDAWFGELTATLRAEQERFGLVLAGGDSSSGGTQVHATLTCLGLVPQAGLQRGLARVGDDVFVSGTLGDAALGLQLLLGKLSSDSAATAELTRRYHTPEPRLALGQQLHELAHAAIDISDGLLMDAARIASASGVALSLQRAELPLSDSARVVLDAQPDAWAQVLAGGDDYELLFTAPRAQRERIEQLRAGVAITRIGEVVVGEGVLLDGAAVEPAGYEHR